MDKERVERERTERYCQARDFYYGFPYCRADFDCEYQGETTIHLKNREGNVREYKMCMLGGLDSRTKTV